MVSVYKLYLGNGKSFSELEQDIVATLTKHGGERCSRLESHSHPDKDTVIEHRFGVYEFPDEGGASFQLSSAPTLVLEDLAGHKRNAYGAVSLLGLKKDNPRYKALDADLGVLVTKYHRVETAQKTTAPEKTEKIAVLAS